ncbi:MAG: hypothetical protein HZA14_02760 [Nitrospirae bacterium]|nr:hypothetical protein [Nitrospirota bacterium]
MSILVYKIKKTFTAEPRIERIPESFAAAYLKDNEDFIVEEEREHFDYVYNVRELVELQGNKFHDKKNWEYTA